MYKISAYITAYQDLEALQDCIAAIQKQDYPVESILIVDNSTLSIVKTDCCQKIIVIHYPENVGISGGLKIGLQWAIEEGYDFLWTFDQDSQPLPDTLEKLVTYYDLLTKSDNQIGIIAPLPIDKITGQIWNGIVFDKYRFIETDGGDNQSDTYECDAVITSGSLVSLAAAKQVELPEEGFFIDAVDWEYCWKFKERNYKVYVVRNAILKHRFGSSRPIKTILRKRDVMVYDYSPLRYYYMCRNHTLVETRLSKECGYLFRSIVRRFEFLAIILVKIIFYESEQKLLKIWACLQGTFDGFIGRLGKTW